MENYTEYSSLTSTKSGNDIALASSFSKLMQKVYLWMTFALVISGLAAWDVAAHPNWLYAIYSSKAIFFGLIIAELAIVFILSGMINRLSLPVAILMFIAYSLLNGVTLSYIFIAYSGESLATVFFITAGTFTAMALVGYFIKKDLSGIGRILMMSLIGLIIASVVNIFLGNGILHMIISYVGVAIFVGLTAYDTQKIKQMMMQASMTEGVSNNTLKLALLGALTLYLDFINLFLMLLRIFGSRD
ncbi:MAG: Bax inhibitor-1/YccA family protein [Paludibacteraceae bacterium]|nr:Bax inhibitor-1/YccA family protein [Paludibacteraceae bacterium]